MRRTQGPSDTVRYSHLGIQFAFVVVLGIWAGAQLDKKLATKSIFTLIGTFAGAGIGFYFLYRETQRIAGTRDDSSPPDSDDAHGRDDPPGGNRSDSDGTTGR